MGFISPFKGLNHILLLFELIYAQLSVAYVLGLAVTIWSSADSSVDRCRFFQSLIPVMSWFCHLVITYLLNSWCRVLLENLNKLNQLDVTL
jgi:hypothetical protein